MTSSKRSRVTATSTSNGPASDQLVCELYDCFMHTSRKQFAQLLSKLLKATSASVLEQVRDEAIKMGALVITKSQFQQCSHRMLDWCFSFLDEQELQTV